MLNLYFLQQWIQFAFDRLNAMGLIPEISVIITDNSTHFRHTAIHMDKEKIMVYF